MYAQCHHKLALIFSALCDMLTFQSMQDRRFDSVSAIYLLLLDRWKRHHSGHRAADSSEVLAHAPTRTERRSSITTGRGDELLYYFSVIFIGTARVVCRAGFMKRYSVHLSVPSDCHMLLMQVCYCGLADRRYWPIAALRTAARCVTGEHR